MPNLRSSYLNVAPGALSDVVLELIASDGRSVTFTAQQVRDHFLAETGSIPQRISATLTWARASIEAALGAEQVPAMLIDLGWDDIRQGLQGITVRRS